MTAAPRLSRPRAFTVVAGALVVTGAVIGALWACIAPPIHGVVALTRGGERVHTYLGPEADHFFVAAALMVALSAVTAVVAAALVWQWRAHRGPGMLAALAGGSAAAAVVSAALGAVLVSRRYGAVDVDGAPVTPEDRVFYFAEPPPVLFGHTPLLLAASLLVPAGVAALVYALCAAASSRDDLGGYPPEIAGLRADDDPANRR